MRLILPREVAAKKASDGTGSIDGVDDGAFDGKVYCMKVKEILREPQPNDPERTCEMCQAFFALTVLNPYPLSQVQAA